MTLREQRSSVSMTQQQCAALLGVSRVTWARWEAGVSAMPPYALRLWRHLVGLERLPWVGGIDSPTSDSGEVTPL